MAQHEINADVLAYVIDCPFEDQEIPADLIHEIASEIVLGFDYTEVYNQIDRLMGGALRSRGLA